MLQLPAPGRAKYCAGAQRTGCCLLLTMYAILYCCHMCMSWFADPILCGFCQDAGYATEPALIQQDVDSPVVMLTCCANKGYSPTHSLFHAVIFVP